MTYPALQHNTLMPEAYFCLIWLAALRTLSKLVKSHSTSENMPSGTCLCMYACIYMCLTGQITLYERELAVWYLFMCVQLVKSHWYLFMCVQLVKSHWYLFMHVCMYVCVYVIDHFMRENLRTGTVCMYACICICV